MKYFITKHCKERYIQKIKNGLNSTDDILIEILKLVSAGKDITNKIFDEVPRYIIHLYEKYENANIKIYLNQNIIFILKKRIGTQDLYDVLTTYHYTDNYLEVYKHSVLSRQDIYIKISLLKKSVKHKLHHGKLSKVYEVIFNA